MNETDEPKVEDSEVVYQPDRVQAIISEGRSKQLIEANRGPTAREVQELREAIAALFDSATLDIAEEEDAEEVSKLLVSANKRISSKKRSISLDNYLQAEKDFKKAYVILERVKKLQKADQAPVWAVMFVAAAYPIIVFILGMFPLPDKVLGLPTLIFAWGFFGGYVAVVFRHLLSVQERWKFEFMWLWVVIRPFLGAIMGAVLYSALVSGVMLFTTQINLESIRDKPLLYFVAFVGGLSEKFWDVLITAVLGPAKITRKQTSDSGSA
jgi:hypothetical protein